jgi:hypothetical protein
MAPRTSAKQRRWLFSSTLIALFLPLFALTTEPLHLPLTQHVEDLRSQRPALNRLDVSKRLVARAGDQSFQARIEKGRGLMSLLNANTNAEAQALNCGRSMASVFTTFDQLARWGWVESKKEIPLYGTKLDTAFTALGITKANNLGYEYIQSKSYLDAQGTEQKVCLP